MATKRIGRAPAAFAAQGNLGQEICGIRSSRFGIVVLSDAFFLKGWTNHELDGLVTRTVAGEQSLLPIWHDLSAEQVRAFSPSLADKVALSTNQFSIEDMPE